MSMSNVRYHLRKCVPIVCIYFLGLFGMIWFLQTKLEAAGKTQFKECVWDGQLTYQFNPKCDICGKSDFRDAYMAGDKKEKMLAKGYPTSGKPLYEQIVAPIESLIRMLQCTGNLEYDEILPMLYNYREYLIRKYHLEKWRQQIFPDQIELP